MDKNKILKIINKGIVLPTVDLLLDISGVRPVIKLAWLPIKIAYGTLSELYPSESESFKQSLKDVWDKNPSFFESPVALQALATTLSTLNRIRSARKREAVRTLYLGGYISAEDKNHFELDRMYDILEKISIEALDHLKFISTDIFKMKEETVKAKVAEMKGNHENSVDWWIKHESKMLHDSVVIQKWITDNFNPNSPKILSRDSDANKDHFKINKYGEEERKIREHFFELESELMSYGILMTQGGTYDSGFSFSVSEFGKRFAKFIPDNID